MSIPRATIWFPKPSKESFDLSAFLAALRAQSRKKSKQPPLPPVVESLSSEDDEEGDFSPAKRQRCMKARKDPFELAFPKEFGETKWMEPTKHNTTNCGTNLTQFSPIVDDENTDTDDGI